MLYSCLFLPFGVLCYFFLLLWIMLLCSSFCGQLCYCFGSEILGYCGMFFRWTFFTTVSSADVQESCGGFVILFFLSLFLFYHTKWIVYLMHPYLRLNVVDSQVWILRWVNPYVFFWFVSIFVYWSGNKWWAKISKYPEPNFTYSIVLCCCH